jgi:hypothetical protein
VSRVTGHHWYPAREPLLASSQGSPCGKWREAARFRAREELDFHGAVVRSWLEG